MDRFEVYLEAVEENEKLNRSRYVVDTASAVGGLFSKNGVSKYLKELDNPEE